MDTTPPPPPNSRAADPAASGPFSRKELMELYELARRDEHFYADQHQKRIAFFTGLLTFIAGGIVLGTSQVEGIIPHLLLLLLPMLLIFLARLAKDGTDSLYRRLLETFTVMAKLETDLGMTQPRAGNTWVEREAYTNTRHMADREDHASSRAFVEAKLSDGYRKVVARILRLAEVVGWATFVLLLLKTIHALLLLCGIVVEGWWCCILTRCM